LEFIRDPGKTMDKKVKRQVLKYTSLDDDLYRRTIDDVFLKCLESPSWNLWSTPVGLQDELVVAKSGILLASYDG
jgi:hypothetical protein